MFGGVDFCETTFKHCMRDKHAYTLTPYPALLADPSHSPTASELTEGGVPPPHLSIAPILSPSLA